MTVREARFRLSEGAHHVLDEMITAIQREGDPGPRPESHGIHGINGDYDRYKKAAIGAMGKPASGPSGNVVKLRAPAQPST